IALLPVSLYARKLSGDRIWEVDMMGCGPFRIHTRKIHRIHRINNQVDMRKTIRVLFPALIVLLFEGCGVKRTSSELIWDASFPRIGSQSSPRATDLNNDGILDIVIGAGENEYQPSNQGVLALDGKTGTILWTQECHDQVYGTPTLYDVTGDGTDDVFIGGRSPHFMALDGRNGNILWQYTYNYEDDPILRHAQFNFNNAVIVPDQHNDGVPDLLTVNGGNSKAAPYSTEGRVPGVMILFNSKTGSIIAADTMPDGRETYMSPLCYSPVTGEEPIVIFGTGG